MEIWGRCGSCDRWFYCAMAEAEPWSCPVCAAEPVAIENRAAGVKVVTDRPALAQIPAT